MKTHSETELLSVVIKTLVEKDESAAREVYLFRKKTGRRPCKDDLLTLIQTCSKYFDRIFVLIDALVREAFQLICLSAVEFLMH